jgi:hypothetical protein
MALCKEIPEAFMAVSSINSPKLPKVISEESRMAKGKANEKVVSETKPSSLKIITHSRPLPTRSSTYFQTNCINRINTAMKNVRTKGPR